MATFRNGLETWLRQDCAKKADDLSSIGSLASAAATASFKGDLELAVDLIDAVLVRVETDLPRNPKKEPEIEQLSKWLNDAYHGKEVVSNMEKFAQMMHKLSYEKVVECQCGRTDKTGHAQFYVGQQVIVTGTNEQIDGEVVTIKRIIGEDIEIQRHGENHTIVYNWRHLIPTYKKETTWYPGLKVKVVPSSGPLTGKIGTVVERYTGGGRDDEWKVEFDNGRTEVLPEYGFIPIE